jgi:hypothetical protein
MGTSARRGLQKDRNGATFPKRFSNSPKGSELVGYRFSFRTNASH